MSIPTGDMAFDALALSAERMAHSTIKLFRSFFAVAGVLAILLGVALLVWPAKSVTVAAVLLSVYIIILAIMRLIAGVAARDVSAGWRVLDVVIALLLLAAGIFMLRNSAMAAVSLMIVLVFVIGFTWITEGVFALIESGRAPSQGWAIFFGIISILAGIIVLATPGWSAVVLMIYAGVFLVVTGVVSVVRAFTFGKDILK